MLGGEKLGRLRLAVRRLCAAGLVLAGGASSVRPVLAEGQPELELVWNAPAECPTRAQTLASLERLLGSPPEREAPFAAAHALIEKRGELFRLELRLRANAAEELRVVDSAHCDELDDAAALIIALAIDPVTSSLGRVRTNRQGPTRRNRAAARCAPNGP